MKTSLLLASTALAALTAVSGVQAASTNVLHRVSIQFTVLSQSSIATNSAGTITEKIKRAALNSEGLIDALGTDTNLTTNGFSSGAYLAFDTVINNGTNMPAILVVVQGSGTNRTLTPVGSAITFSTRGDVLRDGTIKTNGDEALTAYRIRTFDVNLANTLTLNLRGPAIRNVVKVKQGPPKDQITVDVGDAVWTLSGYGDEGTNNTPVLVTGTLTTGFDRVTETP